jgi:hypothetical protein
VVRDRPYMTLAALVGLLALCRAMLSSALMIAPALMTTIVADWGQPGWLVLAAIFLLPAAAAIPATRWALRTRTVAPAT